MSAPVQHKHNILALPVKGLYKHLPMVGGVAHPVRGQVGWVHNFLARHCQSILPSQSRCGGKVLLKDVGKV